MLKAAFLWCWLFRRLSARSHFVQRECEGNTRLSTDPAVGRGTSHIHVGYSRISGHGETRSVNSSIERVAESNFLSSLPET